MPRVAPKHRPNAPLAPRHEPVATEQTPSPRYGQGRGGRPWRSLREQIMKRDGYLCRCDECRASGRLLAAHEVDHISNKRGPDGRLDDRPENLRAINRDCHKAKTARETARARPQSHRGVG